MTTRSPGNSSKAHGGRSHSVLIERDVAVQDRHHAHGKQYHGYERPDPRATVRRLLWRRDGRDGKGSAAGNVAGERGFLGAR